MSGYFRTRDVVGHKIVKVELNRFSTGRGGWAFDPVLTLDNGKQIVFNVVEIEDGSTYGIQPIIRGRKVVLAKFGT